MRVRKRDRARYNWQQRGVFVAGVAIVLLLSACATSTQPPNHPATQPPNLKPANLQPATHHLQQAASWYNRYHALAPDDLLGLKKLTEVCTALEEAGVEDASCQRAAEREMGDQKGRGVRG